MIRYLMKELDHYKETISFIQIVEHPDMSQLN